MIKGSFIQMTIKFPINKERYRQAIDCITDRDRAKFRTQADYVTTAILSYEGHLSDEAASLEMIYSKLKELSEKVEALGNDKKEE